MYACMYISIHIHMYICIYTRVYTYKYRYIYIYVHMNTIYLCICLSIYLYMHTNIHACIHTYTYLCMHISACVCIQTTNPGKPLRIASLWPAHRGEELLELLEVLAASEGLRGPPRGLKDHRNGIWYVAYTVYNIICIYI